MRSAVKSVREGGKGLQHRGKSAYREIRSKMKNSASNLDQMSPPSPAASASSVSVKKIFISYTIPTCLQFKLKTFYSIFGLSLLVQGYSIFRRQPYNITLISILNLNSCHNLTLFCFQLTFQSAPSSPLGTKGSSQTLPSGSIVSRNLSISSGSSGCDSDHSGIRRNNTDLNLLNLTSGSSDPQLSPTALEGPKKVDLDLMTDLKEVIFNTNQPPIVNRQVWRQIITIYNFLHEFVDICIFLNCLKL